LISAIAAALAAFLPITALAQALMEPGAAKVDRAVFRTPAEMKAFEAAHPNLPIMMAPFLPTMDFTEYAAAKAMAPIAPSNVRPAIASGQAPSNPPTHGVAKCNGLGQNQAVSGGGGFPPDTHGAVGADHFGQVVNSGIQFYTKALTGRCPTSIVLSSTLSAFMGYSAQGLFDPRLIYDMTYNRWVVSVEAFPESSTVQWQFIAVSKDSDPTHGWFFYSFNMADLLGDGTGFFWDFPDIGYDEEAIILTGSVFHGKTFNNAEAVFLPKHRMYAGLNFSFCFFNLGNGGTATPPKVLDQSPFTTITMALPGSSPGTIRLTKWTGTSHACPTLVEGPTDVASDVNFVLPPNATQPGTTQVLDASDTRFETAGTQFGEPVFGEPILLWQANTISSSGLPTAVAYRMDVGANTVPETCQFFTTDVSNDFNASITANFSGTTFIAWSSTDAVNNHNPQARFTGKKLGDGCATLLPGILDKESPQPLTGNFDPNVGAQRWGDYSAVTLDPADQTQAWGVNEIVPLGNCLPPNASLTCWKSHFGSMSNP
jgi:hypothetical protein